MPRWRQVKDENGKYHMVPLDEAAVKRDEELGIIVRGNFDAFKSPIDGSLIRNHRDYMEHCRRHGVVPSQEFSREHYEAKAAERAKGFTGEVGSKEILQNKREMYETLMQMERS